MDIFKVDASIDNASEIIDMLVFMGCRLLATKEQLINEIGRGCTKICESGNGIFTTKSEYNSLKEITLQELHDMVVLNRNDPKDANFENKVTGIKYFVDSVGEIYFWGGSWENCHPSIKIEILEPVKEDVMKEYLFKYNDQYTLVELLKEGAESNPEQYIEIPEGAEAYLINPKVKEFLRNINGGMQRFRNDEWINCLDSHINYIDHDFNQIVWIRGEKESINDKIATAEVARQEEKHSHYKKDVSHLNVIDPYRIADLYDLHPCADHIMKKSLCAGNRGHKDTLRDIQDIIDTAERWKQMIEEDNNEI